jgi:hypothetical protein
MATTEVETRLRQLEETLSQRLEKLEDAVAQLKRQVSSVPTSVETAWWKKIVGVYQNDPEFEEAMRLGREYRESLRPSGEDAEEAS